MEKHHHSGKRVIGIIDDQERNRGGRLLCDDHRAGPRGLKVLLVFAVGQEADIPFLRAFQRGGRPNDHIGIALDGAAHVFGYLTERSFLHCQILAIQGSPGASGLVPFE